MDTSAEHTKTAEKSGIAIRGRKRRSIQEKLRIVRETLQSQESVAVIARRHGVNANQVFAWRRHYERGQLEGRSGARLQEPVILPVHVAQPPPVHTHHGEAVEASQSPLGIPRIEIELAEGPPGEDLGHQFRDPAGAHSRSGAAMLSIPAGVRIWLVAGVTDMRRGLDGLSALVQTMLSADVLSGQFFIFRGRRSDRVKIIWHDADGLCLFYKRLDRGKFTWTHAADGAVLLTPAQLSALLEGIDWRRVHRRVPNEEPDPPTVVA